MQVETILRSKGRSVVTISADATIVEAVELLNTHRIGAVVVTDGSGVAGILSERDIVRNLGSDWGALASRPIREVMTRPVISVPPTTSIDDVMERMTERRIRHIPIVEDTELVGIVSIGDVVKSKIEQVETEAEAMRDYIAG